MACLSGVGDCQPALSYGQLEGYWIAAGGPANAAPQMAAIAIAESAGIPNNVQANQPYGTTGWGLWQITPGNSVPSAGIDEALLSPLANARAAVTKFKASLAATGSGFGPWTTYGTSRYYAALQSGVAPIAPSGNGSGGSGVGSVPVVGGIVSGAGDALGSAGNAIGNAAGGAGNVINTLTNPVDAVGSGIASGLRAVGASILPWLLIGGLLIVSLILIVHELGRKATPAIAEVAA